VAPDVPVAPALVGGCAPVACGGVAPVAGFYDQAHMINEFRMFAGSAPTAFFKPHGESPGDVAIRVRGRPSEWRQDANDE